ncbi:ATP-binding protein [uncultured Arcobacter sp.]|uniref:ATP-binding protein n=1 Tax=uncultured Arcobacter sp. TaxID=165434 RepID=UPI002615288B|nr:ATP-binding protein [uncultured Arcobacter sp.]
MYDLTAALSYGITFGILIMTVVYTFIRYIYSKELFYLSYFFMQFFSLLYIVLYSELFYKTVFLQDLSLFLATIFAIVFAIRFYEGKFLPEITNNTELIINTLLLIFIILTAFYHYILFEYLPYTIIYAILFISIIFNLKQGFKASSIYVIGWSLICLILYILDFKTYFKTHTNLDLVLIAFAIEAILFTISVAYKYNLLKKENVEIESMLLQQSKLAQSGEMIANITHQFRQPLNNLSYILINIKKKYENNLLEKEYFDKKTSQANEQIEFLSNTIENFRNFYTNNKDKEDFEIKEVIENSLTILHADIKKTEVDLKSTFNTNEQVRVHGIKNELAQVIVAIISNALDAIKDIENPKIIIEIDSNNADVTLSIKDNANGIKPKILNKIFEPYFSTKADGTGLGLYLSKMIIEKSFQGSIDVESSQEGTTFYIKIEKTI